MAFLISIIIRDKFGFYVGLPIFEKGFGIELGFTYDDYDTYHVVRLWVILLFIEFRWYKTIIEVSATPHSPQPEPSLSSPREFEDKG